MILLLNQIGSFLTISEVGMNEWHNKSVAEDIAGTTVPITRVILVNLHCDRCALLWHASLHFGQVQWFDRFS